MQETSLIVKEMSLPRILVIDHGQSLFQNLSRSLHNQANLVMSSSSSYEEFFMTNTSVVLPEYIAIIVSSSSMLSLNSQDESDFLRRPQYAIHDGAFVDTCFIAVYAPEAAQQPFLRDMLFNNMGVNMVHKASYVFLVILNVDI